MKVRFGLGMRGRWSLCLVRRGRWSEESSRRASQLHRVAKSGEASVMSGEGNSVQAALPEWGWGTSLSSTRLSMPAPVELSSSSYKPSIASLEDKKSLRLS